MTGHKQEAKDVLIQAYLLTIPSYYKARLTVVGSVEIQLSSNNEILIKCQEVNVTNYIDSTYECLPHKH